MTSEKMYKNLHEHRLRLLFAGMLSDKENEHIKGKIEAWGRKQKVAVVSDYVATLDKVNKKVKAPAKPINTQL